jgi:hypothetical protein
MRRGTDVSFNASHKAHLFSTLTKELDFTLTIAQKGKAVDIINRTDVTCDDTANVDATEAFADESANLLSKEEQFQDEWKKTCDVIMKNPESCPHRKHLQVFSSGMEERQVVQASLEQVFQEVHESLNCILEESLACAVPVHEKICSKVSDLESDILALFQRNHDRRRDLLQSLDDYNEMWRAKYSDFTSRVRLESNLDVEHELLKIVDDPVDDPGEFMRSCAQKAKPSSSNAEEKGDDGIHAEFDWESMIELNPCSRSNIETFLDGRSNWNAGCEGFLSCFDEMRETIEVGHTNMLEILESAYSRLSDDLDGVQIDIQEHIISNTHRRDQIEQTLQQVVHQQQTMFSRLMARVGGRVYKNDKEPATETSYANSLRAMIPFASMLSQSK